MSVLLSTPASSSPYHNGGRIAFGPGNKLFAIVGDGHDPSNAQDRSKNLRGKILRLQPGGGVPRDNPVIGGKRSRVYAYGIRNSYGFAFDPANCAFGRRKRSSVQREITISAGRNRRWGPNETARTRTDGPTVCNRSSLSQPDRHHGATSVTGAASRLRSDLFYGAFWTVDACIARY